MYDEGITAIEDIVRRNIAALRAKANLTQQGLADEMLLRGIGWTRETVAQVETTNRRIGLTEAIAVAACLDVPLARLTSTGADSVAVGESRWSTAYVAAAIAGTTADVFPPESYAAPTHVASDDDYPSWSEDRPPRESAPAISTTDLERRRRSRDRRTVDPSEVGSSPDARSEPEPSDAPPHPDRRITAHDSGTRDTGSRSRARPRDGDAIGACPGGRGEHHLAVRR
jgi:transcriptional regulator with XRE-family HTH domain